MDIELVDINVPIPYARNPRNNKDAVDVVAASIKEFGFQQPIVVDKDNVIIVGHTRLLAAKKLMLKEVPVVTAHNLTPQQVKAYRIADNKTADYSEFDDELLALEIQELIDSNYDVDVTGFDKADIENLSKDYHEYEAGSLKKSWGVVPFSILKGYSGEWLERKREWNLLMDSELGRGQHLIGKGKVDKTKYKDINIEYMTQSTSKFDPFLCELLYSWFCPKEGNILDPFAGGSVRGIVAAKLGYLYTGIDISKTQIEENIKQYNDIKNENDVDINWVIGDSNNISNLTTDKYDFIFSCPPYFDLEVYTKNEADISNHSYEDFIAKYKQIIKQSISLLKEDRFACFVVGEIRDKKTGIFHNFIADTINAFTEAGAKYYNEIIYAQPMGVAGLIAGRQFGIARKIRKVHQNILTFVKGNPEKAVNNTEEIDLNLVIGNEFNKTKKVGKVHQKVLTFVKGDSKKATQNIGEIDLSSLLEYTE